MNSINEETLRQIKFFDEDNNIQFINDFVDAAYDYVKILSKGNDVNYYDGDLDLIKSYDTSRRIAHDLVINRINILNRIAAKYNLKPVLDTSNITREDITDIIAQYCRIED